VVKPIQTGVLPGEDGDLAEVRRMTGLTDLHEYVRYDEPLAPATAAARLGEAGPAIAELSDAILQLHDRDLVIVEGAGGAAVRFNGAHEGLCELAIDLGDARERASGGAGQHTLEVVLVAAAGLGTLHDASVTAALLDQWQLGPDHLVIGDWPAAPGLAERCNLTDLPDYTGVPLHGVLEHGIARLPADVFTEHAVRSLTPALGGSFDAADFTRRAAAQPPAADRRSTERTPEPTAQRTAGTPADAPSRGTHP
jgi:dethiobiotin synthetase